MRKEILSFARRMEIKMAMHDGDRGEGWKELSMQFLTDRLDDEYTEFTHALLIIKDKERARKELVDVANFCMMLHNRLNGGE